MLPFLVFLFFAPAETGMNGWFTITMNIAAMMAPLIRAFRGTRRRSSVFFCTLKVIDPPQERPAKGRWR